jgi:hypothetical protein
MTGSGEREQRCETCRFWVPGSSECRRRAPLAVVLPPTHPSASDGMPHAARAGGAWPLTSADQWCGEWAAAAGWANPQPLPRPVATALAEGVAPRLFLARLAPTLETRDPALLGALLDQLPPDVRQVLVRANGLDGRPPAGLKDVAREFKMSQGHVRALLASGEELLAEIVRLLTRDREKV